MMNFTLFYQVLMGRVSWRDFFWFLGFDHKQKKYMKRGETKC